MAYRFALSETSQDGVRRIALEQISKVLARLTGERPSDTTVHDCRKALKRLKALFKLVRGGLPKKTFRREYRVVRDAGRALSAERDLEVLPVTFETLCGACPKISKSTVERVRQAIVERRENCVAEVRLEFDQRSLIIALEAARERYALLNLNDTSFAVFEDGVARGLSKLCEQHRFAVESGEDEAYHDWRKSAQLHWRQMRLLSECCSGLLTNRVRIGKGLADVLGHDHDLSVLVGFVSSLPVAQLKTVQRKALVRIIRERQLTLRCEARTYAQLLIDEKPERFAAGLSAYHAACKEIAALEAPLCNVLEPSRGK